MGSGIDAPCGCCKFVLCPFPTTTWYYATLCRHDNDSAPRSLTPTMISRLEFEAVFEDRLKWQDEVGQSVFSLDPLNHFIYARVGAKLFHIGRGGQVKCAWPGSGEWR